MSGGRFFFFLQPHGMKECVNQHSEMDSAALIWGVKESLDGAREECKTRGECLNSDV